MTLQLMNVLEEKKDLIKRTIAQGCSDQEFELFIQVCKRQGLDPFSKQIFPVKRGGNMTIQTSIDGYRVIAERSGRYMPGKETAFSYNDKGDLLSATAFIKKMDASGNWHEISATAYMDEYKQEYNGKPMGLWGKMPRAMLSKCAESLALRKAFPAEMSGIYTNDEMNQADTVPVAVYINEKESQMICDMIGDDEEYKEKIFNYYKINSFMELKADKLPKILEAIRKHNELRLDEEMKKEAVEVEG